MVHPVIRPEGGRSTPARAIVAGVVALAVIAGGAYLLLGDDGAPSGSAPSDKTVVETLNIGGQADAPDAGDAAQTEKPGDEARALIAELRRAGGSIDLHQVHVRAVRFKNEDKPVDAYLLWFFAAREGHGPSAFVLGEMYDADYYDPAAQHAVIEHPDDAQAFKWYQRALNAGEPMAEERIASLMQRVEQAAANGDEAARRLQLAW